MPLADALRRHLIQQFPADRAYDRAAIHADAMPPLVAAFLDQTLDRWTAMQRDRLRSNWFDFEDGAVREAETRLFDALGPTARVPAAAWESTLGGAVDLVVRFLTIPARALTDAVFEGEPDPLPAETVRERLILFDAYPYLAEAARAYLDQPHLDTVAPDDLFHVLDRADRRKVQGYEAHGWLTLLGPLFDLARSVPALGGVPASVLRDFFEAKGADALAERVGERGVPELDEAALRDALGSEDGEQKAENGERRTEDGGRTTGEDGEHVAAGAADASVPLWQRFAREGGDGSVNARFEDRTPDLAAPADPPLWQQFSAPDAEPSARPPAAKVPAPTSDGDQALEELEGRVLGRTTSGQRSRFVEHLFQGNAGTYATVLHALDAAASWTEASQIIARDVFRPFRVNIYGEHAVAFTDAVEARFQG
ncbi:MAG: hypothetical protein AAGI91_04350 [Bacteroidota bacterium]